MNFRSYFRFAAIAIAALALVQVARAQTGDGKIANMTVGGASIRWDILVANAGGSVTVSIPDGRSFQKNFRPEINPEFKLSDRQLEGLPDGVYTYEIRLTPQLSGAQKDAITKARGSDDEPESDRNMRRRPALPSQTQTGSFALVNGMLIGPGAIEGERTGSNSSQPQTKPPSPATNRVSANTVERLRNHRFSLLRAPDIVQADDVIIQGSLCVGLDCVNNESFGFDTVRLKENNTRIKFDDTSTSAGFPNNDWQLTANDSASGGANKFSIEDITGAKVPFTITAGAPTNSLFVASSGKVGLGNSSPVLNVHITATDTPALRQEQTNGGGFTAQTWDIGANEANWFVRDVTGGSRLPFRIRPGAPTSSIDVSASGNVGIGTASPASKLDVQGDVQVLSGNVVKWSSNDTNSTRIFTFSNTYGIGTNATDLTLFSGGAGGITFTHGGVTSAAQVRIDSTGNLGIGTTSPDQKLSVSGDADKSAGGTSWGVFSDERLKDIKGGYTRGLGAVLGLQPVRFSYKKDNALALQSDSEIIGFSAQALQKIVPEAVSRNANGYLVVHSDPILWAMLNAIKEQQQQIQQLQGQIKKLQTAHRRRHR